MEVAKREHLEAQGWKVGAVEDFLDLTPDESMLIEMKLAQDLRSGSSRASRGWRVQSRATSRCRLTCCCAQYWRQVQRPKRSGR